MYVYPPFSYPPVLDCLSFVDLARGGTSLGKLAKDMVAFTIIDSYLDAKAAHMPSAVQPVAVQPADAPKHTYTLTADGRIQKLIAEALALSTFMAIA